MTPANMKISPEEAKESTDCCAPSDDGGPIYPYGLQIYLNDETLAKLGIAALPNVGTKVAFRTESPYRCGRGVGPRAYRYRHGWQRVDVTQAHALLHGDEVAAMGDAGYQGVEKREENLGNGVTWHVAMKRAKHKALPANRPGRMTEKLEHLKASVRAKVEHPFHVVKILGAIGKHATVAWQKTPRNCSRCSASRIWCWLVGNLGSQKPELRPDHGHAGEMHQNWQNSPALLFELENPIAGKRGVADYSARARIVN